MRDEGAGPDDHYPGGRDELMFVGSHCVEFGANLGIEQELCHTQKCMFAHESDREDEKIHFCVLRLLRRGCNFAASTDERRL